VFAAFLVGGLLVAVVAAQALVAQNAFRLQDLQGRISQLQQTTDDLRLQVALDSAPGRIAEEARKLGLRLPPSDHVYSLPVAEPAMGRTGSRTPPFPNGSPPGSSP
jgi:cell division protein FtsL